MKKLATLFLALALCMGLAVPAFAATVTEDKYTLSFGEHEIAEETLTFYEYDYAQGKAVGVPKTVKAVHMNVGDTVTLTGNADPMILHMDFLILASGDVGYSSTTAIGTTREANTTAVTIPDPIPMHEYLGDDSASAKYVIECSMTVEGSEERLDTYYIILGNGSTPTEPTTPTEPEKPVTPVEPTTPTEPEKPVTPIAPATPNAPGSYTVKKGDTWGTIALNNYGTYGAWRELYKANKYVKLAAGLELTLPEKLGNTVRISAPAAGAGETLYTVKAGDTLGAIAKATYGDVMKYKAIFERNSDRLKNANTIYEGQVIVLPAK